MENPSTNRRNETRESVAMFHPRLRVREWREDLAKSRRLEYPVIANAPFLFRPIANIAEREKSRPTTEETENIGKKIEATHAMKKNGERRKRKSESEIEVDHEKREEKKRLAAFFLLNLRVSLIGVTRGGGSSFQSYSETSI